jgi:hypothetical protein
MPAKHRPRPTNRAIDSFDLKGSVTDRRERVENALTPGTTYEPPKLASEGKYMPSGARAAMAELDAMRIAYEALRDLPTDRRIRAVNYLRELIDPQEQATFSARDWALLPTAAK